MRLEVWLEVYSGMESYVLLPIASHVCLQSQNIEEYQHREVAHIIKKSKLLKTAVQTEERPSCIQFWMVRFLPLERIMCSSHQYIE